MEEVPKNILTSSFHLMDFHLDNLGVPNQLIICLSPQWIPPNYRNLYFSWMDICGLIHKTHFNIEG